MHLLYKYRSFEEFRVVVVRLLEWCNSERLHRSLGYLARRQYSGKATAGSLNRAWIAPPTSPAQELIPALLSPRTS